MDRSCCIGIVDADTAETRVVMTPLIGTTLIDVLFVVAVVYDNVNMENASQAVFGGGGGARQCCMYHGNAIVEGASRGAGDAQGESEGKKPQCCMQALPKGANV
jgi:hypothetical protein